MARTLRTGPDMRYACVMNDGKKFVGTRLTVAKNAARATRKNKGWVVLWGAPGHTTQAVTHRINSLIGAYLDVLERLERIPA
jgi:hypothetical protein